MRLINKSLFTQKHYSFFAEFIKEDADQPWAKTLALILCKAFEEDSAQFDSVDFLKECNIVNERLAYVIRNKMDGTFYCGGDTINLYSDDEREAILFELRRDAEKHCDESDVIVPVYVEYLNG